MVKLCFQTRHVCPRLFPGRSVGSVGSRCVVCGLGVGGGVLEAGAGSSPASSVITVPDAGMSHVAGPWTVSSQARCVCLVCRQSTSRHVRVHTCYHQYQLPLLCVCHAPCFMPRKGLRSQHCHRGDEAAGVRPPSQAEGRLQNGLGRVPLFARSSTSRRPRLRPTWPAGGCSLGQRLLGEGQRATVRGSLRRVRAARRPGTCEEPALEDRPALRWETGPWSQRQAGRQGIWAGSHVSAPVSPRPHLGSCFRPASSPSAVTHGCLHWVPVCLVVFLEPGWST